ncbi:MAG TPA: glycosyltransferase family 4 protein [Herpetosiphonaceae bacterium]
MRVLMLTQFYPPYIGGEERHVRNLSTKLAARGHDVAVATLWNHGLREFEDDQGVRVYRVRGTMQRIERLFSESARRHAPPFPDPELALALQKVIRRERPQIVHAHNWMTRSFVPLKAWSGARLVLTVHDHSVVCPKKKLIYNDDPCSGPARGKCLGCASTHYGKIKGLPVALSNVVMSTAERAAVDMFVPVSSAVGHDNGLLDGAVPARVIPNFVPDDIGALPHPEGARPHPNLAQLPAGEFMLFVGAFGRYKGLDVLVRAYAELESAPPLVIIGYHTPEYPVRTVDFPPNVHVLRDWPHEAVMQAWQRCMFGLIPSIWSDPCPTVAMEAMSTGRALIASRIGGLTDLVVDGETGLLVEPGDHRALAQAMRRLLDDRALCRRMGDAGRRHVVGFQASTVVQRIEDLYDELLAR